VVVTKAELLERAYHVAEPLTGNELRAMATYSISPPMTRALKWAELGELTGPSNNSSIRALLKRDMIEAETATGTYRGHLVLRWKITASAAKA
jgi:hypothetical protein